MSPHLSTLYKQAYQYVGNASDAEDLLQDLLVHLYSQQGSLTQVDNLPAWLNRCLYHRFIDKHRKLKRAPEFQEYEENTLIGSNTAGESSYYHRQILQCMSHLSRDQRAVVSMHDIEGYTLPELSNMMDIPVGTLKSHLHRGRRKLKTLLEAGSQPRQTELTKERVQV